MMKSPKASVTYLIALASTLPSINDVFRNQCRIKLPIEDLIDKCLKVQSLVSINLISTERSKLFAAIHCATTTQVPSFSVPHDRLFGTLSFCQRVIDQLRYHLKSESSSAASSDSSCFRQMRFAFFVAVS